MGSLLDYRRFALCAVYSAFGLTAMAYAQHRPGIALLGELPSGSAWPPRWLRRWSGQCSAEASG